MNLCVSCGEQFGSVSAFDAHRVGVHAYTCAQGLRMEPPKEDGRRCLYVWEMEQMTRHELQVFSRNARGTWSLHQGLLAARRRSAT